MEKSVKQFSESKLFERVLNEWTVEADNPNVKANMYLESVDLNKITDNKTKKEACANAFTAGVFWHQPQSGIVKTEKEIEEMYKNGIISHELSYYAVVVGEYFTFYEGKDLPIEEAIKKSFVDGADVEMFGDWQKRLHQKGYSKA